MKTQQEMFEAYKNRLLEQARDKKGNEIFFDGTIPPKTGWTRYNVIEYLCQFTKINPVEMAAALQSEGIRIYFDDSSISVQENKKKENAVKRYCKN